jgi:hypothetical protein
VGSAGLCLASLGFVVMARHSGNPAPLAAVIGGSLILLVAGARMVLTTNVPAAPRAEPSEPAAGETPRPAVIDMKAISVGVLVDWCATYVYTAIISVLGPLLLLVTGMPPQEAGQAFVGLVGEPALVASIFLPLGFSFTALGGFVASRLSDADTLLNSAFVGSLGILLGLLVAGENPRWVGYASTLGTVPAAMIGGLFHTRRFRFL